MSEQPTTPVITELPNQQLMVCPKCGMDAACQCGVAPITRAAYALRTNPEKSDRAIAKELGIGHATVSRARQRGTVSPETVDKRVGLDGKVRAQPRKPVARDERLTERRPDDAVRIAEQTILKTFSEVPASDRRSFDSLVEKTTLAYRDKLRAEYALALKAETEELKAELKAETEKMRERSRLAEAEREKAFQIRCGIDSHMTQDEFKLVLGFLHPDRHSGNQDRAGKAFAIFKRLEETVNTRTPISALRERGWEKVSPFYRAPTK